MRIAITLDPDIAQQIRQRMAERRLSKTRVVNDALRKGLAEISQKQRLKPFKVEPFAFEFQPGIDHDNLKQALDELEVEDYLEKRRRDPAAPANED
jgi:hypothetical protein